jgi:hypothetical protein
VPLTRNTEEAAQVVVVVARTEWAEVVEPRTEWAEAVEPHTEWPEAEAEFRMASAEVDLAAAEPRTDLAGAEVRVALVAAEHRMLWAAEESLTAWAAAGCVSAVGLMVGLISAVRLGWAVACIPAVDGSGAHLISVAHPMLVAGTWAAGKPDQGSPQGRVPAVSVRLRRMAIGLPAMEKQPTRVETPRSVEIETQQTSAKAGTLRV